MQHVITYDISNDKRRAKVAKIMEGYGFRVQYSVFECDLDRKKLAELKQRLRPLVNKREWESIRFYPICGECKKKTAVIGKDLGRELEPVIIV